MTGIYLPYNLAFVGVYLMLPYLKSNKVAGLGKKDPAFYKMLVDNSFDWEYMLDSKGNLIYMSPSCEMITGYSASEFHRNPGLLMDIINPDDRSRFKLHADCARDQERAKSEILEVMITTKSGKTEWISHACRPVFDKNGEFIGTRVSNRPITDQKMEEAQLLEISHLHESIVNQAPLGIAICDLEGACVYANPAMASVFATSTEDILRQNLYTDAAAGPTELRNVISKSIDEENFEVQELEFAGGAGAPCSIKLKVVPVEFLGKRSHMLLVENVTRRRLAERELAATAERFKAITTQIQEGIGMTLPDGRYVYVNPAFCRMTGYSEKELLKMSIFDIRASADIRNGTFEKTRAEGVCINETILFKRKDGSAFHASVTAQKVEIGGDEFCVGCVRDITAIIEYEERLREANRLKDQFLSIISHDLRSPFNALLGLSEILPALIDNREYDELQEIAYIFKQTSRNTYHLLENLLTWSKSQQEDPKFSPGEYLLRERIEEAVQFLQQNAASKQIEIIMDVPGNATVLADSDMLDAILRNFLSNAIKFSNEGGSIVFKERKEAGFSCISISDNGQGMPREQVKNLFKLDKASSSRGTKGEKGTGLGLLICHEFVRMHGGRIAVDSKPNQGTTFSIFLPDKTD